MSNPLGERAPAAPVPGGCGSAACADRAWFAIEVPDDPPTYGPCALCTSAIIATLSARQLTLLRANRRMCKRNLHDLDDPANLGHAKGDYAQTFCLPCRREYQRQSDARRRAALRGQAADD